MYSLALLRHGQPSMSYAPTSNASSTPGGSSDGGSENTRTASLDLAAHSPLDCGPESSGHPHGRSMRSVHNHAEWQEAQRVAVEATGRSFFGAQLCTYSLIVHGVYLHRQFPRVRSCANRSRFLSPAPTVVAARRLDGRHRAVFYRMYREEGLALRRKRPWRHATAVQREHL